MKIQLHRKKEFDKPIHEKPVRKSHRMLESEFNLTTQIMNLFDIYPDSDYILYTDTDYGCVSLTSYGSKPIAFAERITSIDSIPYFMSIFRPFKSDKHANMIIKMFEESTDINYDTLEIREMDHNGKIKYSGWLTLDGEKIESSYIKSSPSIPILKMSIVASMMMDEEEHAEYIKNLHDMLGMKHEQKLST